MNTSTIGQLPARNDLVGALLGRVAYNLDLTKAQYERARSAYETVSSVLAVGAPPALAHSKVFAQGSFALGTVIRPITEDCGFDVDLICRLAATSALTPAKAMRLIGAELKADGRYADKLQAKTRCWRICYEGDFHLDVAPVVPAGNGADLIPDRQLRCWIETHPEAFAAWFNALAEAARTQRLIESLTLKAEVTPFPADPDDRGWLRRIVQLLKRHRDLWVQTLAPWQREFAPISVIITTLAGYSFERVARSDTLASPYEVMRAIVVGMTDFIETRQLPNGQVEHWVHSPVANENFANRWNQAPDWYEVFLAWNKNVQDLFYRLERGEGLDTHVEVLTEAFGRQPAQRTLADFTAHMSRARQSGTARVVTGVGLVAGAQAAGALVRPHTFYGDD